MTRREIDAVFDEIVEFSGLEEFIDSPVKYYSSGMYVRLGFAVAVHVDPDILIIDEVIAVGDEEFQRSCFDHLYTLRRKGVTIVLVTHGLADDESRCATRSPGSTTAYSWRTVNPRRSCGSTSTRSTSPKTSGSRRPVMIRSSPPRTKRW